MRDWASDLRAIADGRLMLNVRNGVTVSRSMLAMIADEIDALRAVLLTPAEVGGHADAQTEARAIVVQVVHEVNGGKPGGHQRAAGIVATALAANDAELEKVKAECDKWREAFGEMHRQTMRAEAQLAEANKALVIANAQLDNMEFLSVEGFMDWQQEYRVARRAREAQGGENG